MHTKGKWNYSEGFEGTFDIHADVANLKHHTWIATVECKQVCDKAEQEANARLIAAAPELLEALTQMLQQVEAGCDPSTHAIRNAYAAMTAATKEQK